MARGVK